MATPTTQDLLTNLDLVNRVMVLCGLPPVPAGSETKARESEDFGLAYRQLMQTSRLLQGNRWWFQLTERVSVDLPADTPALESVAYLMSAEPSRWMPGDSHRACRYHIVSAGQAGSYLEVDSDGVARETFWDFFTLIPLPQTPPDFQELVVQKTARQFSPVVGGPPLDVRDELAARQRLDEEQARWENGRSYNMLEQSSSIYTWYR